MQVFTKEELAKFNGKEGRSISLIRERSMMLARAPFGKAGSIKDCTLQGRI